MEKDVFHVFFVGSPLKPLSELKLPGLKTGYFDTPDGLIRHVEETAVPGLRYVVFTYLEDGESARQLISSLQHLHPGLLLSMALIACMPGGYADDMEVLTSFDYVTFHALNRKSVVPAVHYAWTAKERSLESEKQFRLYGAIYDEMLRMREGETGPCIPGSSEPDLYYGVDRNGVIRAVNDRVLEILGFSREEVVGRHLGDFIMYDEFKEVKSAFSERRTGQRRLENLTLRFRKKDGSYEEFSVDAEGVHVPSVQEQPNRDPKRVHIGTIGKARRKGVVHSVDLFASSGLPLVIYDPDGGRLMVNRGFEQFSGYRQEEIEDKSPEFFEQGESANFSRSMKEIFQKKRCVYNTIFVDRAKRERFCEVTLDLLELDGKPAVIGLYNDVSSFLSMIDEAERLIHLSWVIGNCSTIEDLFEVAAENVMSVLKVPFVAFSALDDEQKEVDKVYVQSVELRGWFSPADEFFVDYLAPLMNEAMAGRKTVYRSLAESPFAQKGRSGTEDRTVCSVQQLFGKEDDGTFITAPLEVNNVVIGNLTVYQRKEGGYSLRRTRLFEMSTHVIAAGINKLQLEGELKKHLEDLESRVKERTKELEDFIYTVSHDLKSPLHAARGFAQMIRKQFDPMVRTREDEFILRRVEENVNQAIKMIDDLLQLSRIGTREPELDTIDLNAIIRNYFLEFNALKRGEVSVEFEIKGELPPIIADRGRMVQMFTNIFDNAVRYRKGDSVRITVNGEVVGNRVRISVDDNGTGIDEGDLPNVFRIFYRGKNGGKIPEGTGVGLAIVKRIVEQHGGTAQVKSVPGEGTTVLVELPLHR